jgi:hypothetical protein
MGSRHSDAAGISLGNPKRAWALLDTLDRR